MMQLALPERSLLRCVGGHTHNRRCQWPLARRWRRERGCGNAEFTLRGVLRLAEIVAVAK